MKETNHIKPTVATRLGWVAYLNDTASEMIARSLPLFIVLGLGLTPTVLGLIEGLAEVWNIFIKGFSGWLSDRMPSRKPLITFGYSCSAFARFLFLFTAHPILIGLGRILDRTGKGVREAPRDAMIADTSLYNVRGRSFGITRFLDNLGGITGMAILFFLGFGSASMTADQFHMIVYLSLPFGIAAVLLLILWVPKSSRKNKLQPYISFKIPKNIRGFLGVIFIFSLAKSSDAFLVLRAQQLGFDFSTILVIFIVFNVISASLSLSAGILSDRFGRLKFLGSGWFIFGIVYLGIGFITSQSAFIFFLALYGVFYGLTEGIERALMADILADNERGIGYGALQFTLGLAALPASLLMGVMMTNLGNELAFIIEGCMALFAVLLLIIWNQFRS